MDVAGIFDPTPISDGTNSIISVFRGNWDDAVLSFIAIAPFVGDAIGKGGKAGKALAKGTEKGIEKAAAKELEEAGEKAAKKALGKVEKAEGKGVKSSKGPGKGVKGGGHVNKVKPVEGAGPHTGFKRDPQTGKVTGYTEFDGAGKPVKRFRGEGSPHGGVDPPLVLEPKPGKGPGSPTKRARPARPDEIPGGKQ